MHTLPSDSYGEPQFAAIGNATQRVADDLSALADRITDASQRHTRFMLGIVGEPGAGKSTVSEYLTQILGARAVVVPFDGFHLANVLLRGTDLQARKGAIDTFDLAGYRVLIQRLRAADEPIVYAPAYRREVEEPIAAAITIRRGVPIVIVEGNYLLDDQPDLAAARALLDEVWYVQTADQTRLHRLIQRHIRFGKTHAEATAWATGSDEANAHAVRATRDRADLVIEIP